MKNIYEIVKVKQRNWLVTGAAGFIGSNLVEALLSSGQKVIGLDNFSTGYSHNLDQVRKIVGEQYWMNFSFLEGDICDHEICAAAVKNIDHVLHQAALGSVPRSIADPITTNLNNISGFLNILDAARQENVRSFVYAASSSTYGDESSLPKQEDRIGSPLSPYAVTKLVNELYASVYARTFDFKATGLRYFNVFGPRQDPNGAYAAVIPKWTSAIIRNENLKIYGDGLTSRDFCYVANAVQANLLAALAPEEFQGEVYNVAVGERTSLNDLLNSIVDELKKYQINFSISPEYGSFRPGDVRHSLADIRKITKMGYQPTHNVSEGLAEAMPWYIDFFKNGASRETR